VGNTLTVKKNSGTKFSDWAMAMASTCSMGHGMIHDSPRFLCRLMAFFFC
jgi:hypothetical protein